MVVVAPTPITKTVVIANLVVVVNQALTLIVLVVVKVQREQTRPTLDHRRLDGIGSLPPRVNLKPRLSMENPSTGAPNAILPVGLLLTTLPLTMMISKVVPKAKPT